MAIDPAKMKRCPDCDGCGEEDPWEGLDAHTCSTCHGSGYIIDEEPPNAH